MPHQKEDPDAQRRLETYKRQQEQQQEDAQREIRQQIMDTGLPPWGLGLALVAFTTPVAINNRNQIRRRKGQIKSFIAKDKKAEDYIASLRAAFMQAYRAIRQEVGIQKAPLTILIRADVFILYAQDDKARGAMKTSDIDNHLKGVFDALKWGEIVPGVEWGLVKDDSQITESFTVKGQAPDDGQGSRIVVVFSRAGYRDPDQMAAAIQNIRPAWPWIPEVQDPSKIIKPTRKPLILPGGSGPSN